MKYFIDFFYRNFFISILVLFFITSEARTQTWQPLGTGAGGTVNAMTVYGGQLIVGGYFSVAGGILVNNIARWNGSSWQPLGLGTNDTVFSLAVYGSFLVAGGRFTTAGGVSCNKIAFWNGTSWNTTGGTINGNVLTLAVQGTTLFAGGNFTVVNGKNSLRIARWLNYWDTIGTGFNSDLNVLAVYNSQVYAGGSFTIADGLPASRIARWDGSRWASLGVGMDDGSVYCMRVFNSSLYVGGTFTAIGGSTTNRIARWNGTSWSNVSFGFSSGVFALHSYGTILYAGGDFAFADFLPASKVASYNGSTWSALGSGIGGGSNPKVKAVYSFLGDIIFGGTFTLAGGQAANNIANWKLTTGITPLGNIIPENYSLEQNYPNPFNPSTKIKFSIPAAGNTDLSLYDSKGSLISNILNSNLAAGVYELTIDASVIPSGVYFYKLRVNDFSQTRKMIVLK